MSSSKLLTNSQQPLPSQINLLRKLALAPSTLGSANRNAVAEFRFIFYTLPGAGAVVREVDAGEGAGAEVVCALCCAWG
jgi:hypothetical protein